MSAYASAQRGRPPAPVHLDRSHTQGAPLGPSLDRRSGSIPSASPLSDSVFDALIGHIAERIAAAVATRLAESRPDDENEWLDSRGAAEYLGVHRDTLRKLAAERAIPTEQDGPGCKLFFRRVDLDEWRRRGGRAAHLSAVLDRAA